MLLVLHSVCFCYTDTHTHTYSYSLLFLLLCYYHCFGSCNAPYNCLFVRSCARFSTSTFFTTTYKRLYTYKRFSPVLVLYCFLCATFCIFTLSSFILVASSASSSSVLKAFFRGMLCNNGTTVKGVA